MKKVKWVLLLAVVAFAIFIAANWDEIQAHADAEAVKADADVERIQTRTKALLKPLADALRAAEDSGPKRCAEVLEPSREAFLSVSLDQLKRLAGRKSKPKPQEWYRGADADDLLDEIAALASAPADRAAPNKFDLRDAAKAVLAHRHLAVIVPTAQGWPKLIDAENFQGGSFDGWVFFVDAEQSEPLCHIRFTAKSSDLLEGGFVVGVAYGLIEIPLSDAQAKAEEDFVTNFWKSFTLAAQDAGALAPAR